MKNSILENGICHRIAIQTPKFLAALPTCQDGVENHVNLDGLLSCDKVSLVRLLIVFH